MLDRENGNRLRCFVYFVDNVAFIDVCSGFGIEFAVGFDSFSSKMSSFNIGMYLFCAFFCFALTHVMKLLLSAIFRKGRNAVFEDLSAVSGCAIRCNVSCVNTLFVHLLRAAIKRLESISFGKLWKEKCWLRMFCSCMLADTLREAISMSWKFSLFWLDWIFSSLHFMSRLTSCISLESRKQKLSNVERTW